MKTKTYLVKLENDFAPIVFNLTIRAKSVSVYSPSILMVDEAKVIFSEHTIASVLCVTNKKAHNTEFF